MNSSGMNIREKLNSKGLKVTPQRVLVYEALLSLDTHPTAEEITANVRERNPNISIGTIYNILDTLVEKGLILRVRTDRDKMRYDAIISKHHHLYDINSDKIEDFYDEELDKIIESHFKERNIPGFDVYDIKLQIVGKYKGKTDK